VYVDFGVVSHAVPYADAMPTLRLAKPNGGKDEGKPDKDNNEVDD
jgi:hypothetical protein